jgi:hypothetical protein
MKKTLFVLEKLYGRSLAEATTAHLAEVADRQTRATRHRAAALLSAMRQERGSKVTLGETEWNDRIELPIELLVKSHSIMTGGTGSGKTMAALLLIDAILRAPEYGFGVLDAKGDLFERTLLLVSRLLDTLPQNEARRLADRIVIVDLASPDPLTSYNIACPWSGSDLDFFATSRVGTFQELLPSGDGLTLRGSAIVKNVLMLLAEHRLPFSYFDRVLSSEPFRAELLSRSGDADVRQYFQFHFRNEGRATIAAVQARIVSSLLSSLSLKLALSGETAPDFRELQDGGKIVLINCAGPNISRPVARTLQALFLSDIRQAVFARKVKNPYLWVCDEAQNFFRTRQLRENMTELLTMSRSFGSFFLYLTQNITTAVQEGEMLETLHTNTRWSLSMRGTSKDGAFLREAIPVTGRMPKPRINPYAPVEFYSPAEERSLLLSGLAHLPDRTGWLWLKSKTGEAMKIQTATLTLPEGTEFRETVDRIRGNPRIGQRMSRSAFMAEIARRDEFFVKKDEPDAVEQLKKSYKAEEELVQ